VVGVEAVVLVAVAVADAVAVTPFSPGVSPLVLGASPVVSPLALGASLGVPAASACAYPPWCLPWLICTRRCNCWVTPAGGGFRGFILACYCCCLSTLWLNGLVGKSIPLPFLVLTI
jgi:hypothetical protein